MLANKVTIGIYEKALPKDITWEQRLSLAKELGYDYVEISIDETDERLARLDWSLEERQKLNAARLEIGVDIRSMCLSGHRRFPFGSHNPEVREEAKVIMTKAIKLAQDLGIRNIQLAGYDVYYEEQDAHTIELFKEGMLWTARLAAQHQVMVSVEIMDTEFMSSITRWLEYQELVNNPWFCVYPDVGNLSAWNDNVSEELTKGIGYITAIHLKDTYKVTPDFPGQFRDVPFGQGCVDFVEVFKTLKSLDYKGAFLIEMWTEKADDPVAELKHAKEWILEQMKTAGFI
ncbi:xylulose 5-phosphate 3-epimerase [Psittacicella melopsittaci]|uniref:L-ribulose-5-phosphate 3-epimerase n=1 Tax=Psittacicella melopsittaci TaxID=2028576 RepID=A0A3A1Y4D4_9GAMM|nr:L-ribulose-5-phosphate 3-epimerase [Psittacicella melopsittaci]RIY32311.1 xylulose 5-phosphate 3-epimerase [Psittacicella melopsittaci]